MKIDITYGVFRTLQFAEAFRQIMSEPPMLQHFDVSALGVLLAMLDEDEYRAAHWLAEYGITREKIASVLPFEQIALQSEQIIANKKTQPSYLADTAVYQKNNAAQNNSSHNDSQQNNTLHNAVIIEPRLRFYLDADAVTVGRLENSLMTAIFSAARQLHEILPRVLFSTEHLLLALTLEENEVGSFLRNHHLTPERMLDKIAQIEQAELFSDEVIPLDDETQADDESQNFTLDHNAETQCVASLPKDIAFLQNENNSNQNKNNFHAVTTNRNEHQTVYRILDASANRAMEAIRVLEDYVRFGLDDSNLTALLKQMRHELAAALRELPQQTRLVSRNTANDVGTEIEGQNEYRRMSLDDVLRANVSRLQESLRSIEEYGKIVAPNLARTVEQIRYQTYTFHQILFAAVNVAAKSSDAASNTSTFDETQKSDKQKRIADAKLYVLVDARNSEEEFAELILSIIRGGANVIQLRDKNASDRLLLSRAEKLCELIRTQQTSSNIHTTSNVLRTSANILQTSSSVSRPLIIINDRPDIAVLSGADGVHVGQDELSIDDVRRLVSPNMLIGVSTHSIEQARQAEQSGADYIGVGPTFPSPTKQFTEFPGLNFLKQVAAEIRLPAFAIGGITLENFSHVLATGITQIAVQSVVIDSDKPEEICRLFLK